MIQAAVATVIAAAVRACDGREISRLKENQGTLLRENMEYRTKDGKWASEVSSLKMTVDEYRNALKEADGKLAKQEEALSSLRVKVGRLSSIQQTQMETRVDTVVRIIRDTTGGRLRTAGYIRWSDPWVSLTARIRDDSADVSLTSSDTLYQVVHRVPKRFLFFRFGTKEIRQEIVSSNPHSRITYSELIELK